MVFKKKHVFFISLLHHTNYLSDPVMEQIQPIAKGKGKGKEKEKKPPKTASGGKKGKPNEIAKIEPMEKAIPPEYITKNWSGLALRGQNSNLKVNLVN